MKHLPKFVAVLAVSMLTMVPVSPAGAHGGAGHGGQGMEGMQGMGGMQGMQGRGGMHGQRMMGPGMMRGGMGGGMMGGGMGPGMMGGGMGRGMGPGMMGGGMGPGMMGGGMRGGMGPGAGMRVTPSKHLSIEDVRHFMEHHLARRGNKRLVLGAVKEASADVITADVVTVDGSLVRRVAVDRHSGRIRKMAAEAKPTGGMQPMPGMKRSMSGMKPMEGMQVTGAPTVPAVTGYSEGQKILFMHTETSDPKIAKILTDMMGGSPVPVVPALANAPKEMLAGVYVFTNGKTGDGPMGPLGGQPDIFDNPPGDPAYSPLRAVTLITWKDGASPRTLKSMAELQAAIDRGEVRTKAAGVVVNMPFLTWPGGKR